MKQSKVDRFFKAKRRILFITGTRADYGKLKPLITVAENIDSMETGIFVTGMHMLSHYGHTFDEILKSGHKNIYYYINQKFPNNLEMDLILAETVKGIGLYIREFIPDLIIVHGDRIEALAGAIVGSLNNILVSHIEGGELSGTIDEILRHSISKLSHIHFVSNIKARNRLVQMGEDPSSVFVIGSPEVDLMLSDSLPNLDIIRNRYRIFFDSYSIFIYHPVTSEFDTLSTKIKSVIRALLASKRNYVVLYPNNDSGFNIIQNEIESLDVLPRFLVLPSIRFEHFLTLLKHSDFIIGNSSCGIREAPVYGVPTINIGTRQRNRFHNKSIRSVSEDENGIVKAIESLPKSFKTTKHFGDGKSASRFKRIIRSEKMWNLPHQKQFIDV